MRLYSLFCSALFIPLILGTNDNTTNPEHKSSTVSIPKKSTKTVQNATKYTLITEGGAITENTSSLNLTAVHKELGNQSHSTIASRKGVSFNDTDLPVKNGNAAVHEIDKPVENKATAEKTVIDLNNTSTAGTSTTKPTVKPKVTKPPILSSEALEKLNFDGNTAESSHKRLSSGAGVPTKAHPSSPHPGMVMPLIIGVLVVPMFAVLGYLALRRGQEAWKNRHYKRMDFLLDGMYNE